MKRIKKISTLLFPAVLLLAMTACGLPGGETTRTTAAPASTVSEAETTAVPAVSTGEAETPAPTETQASSHPQVDGYNSVLDQYVQALAEKWDEETLTQAGLSPLCASYDNPLEQIGYALLDVNGDGQRELFIGAVANDGDMGKMIFALYTMANGAPVRVFASQERSACYLCADEAGVYQLENQTFIGTNRTDWYYSLLDGDSLTMVQGIACDADADPERAWFSIDSAEQALSDATPMDASTAQGIVDSYNRQHTKPDYTPLVEY